MIKPAPFRSDGPPLSVEIRSGFAQPGAYTIIFWAKDANAFFRPDARGNFINDDDDRYRLDGAAGKHDGRILDCIVTLRLVPPIKNYRLELVVYQGEEVIGSDVIEGESDAATVSHELFLQLEAVQP